MRGRDESLTRGERVAIYRRRRQLTQEVLGGMVGRSTDWVQKIENNRADLDRLKVLQQLAEALDITVGDLLGEPVLLEWSSDSTRHTVPALRRALTDWRNHLPIIGSAVAEPTNLGWIKNALAVSWRDYQESRYGRVAATLPSLVTATSDATRTLTGDEQREAFQAAAEAHQLSTVYLTKLGETDLAALAASRGLDLAQRADTPATIGALYRSNVHALAAMGHHDDAAALADRAATHLAATLGRSDASGLDLSMLGMLHLVGALAAAAQDSRQDALTFLRSASSLGQRLGEDANFGYSAFGPTNVEIHRVSAAVELGDIPTAVLRGVQLDTEGLPVERRVRHSIETARALALFNQVDQAIEMLLDAERLAPEQVRYHRISRELVRRAIRARTGGRHTVDLAGRMGVAEL